MSMYLIKLQDVQVNLNSSPTIKIMLPTGAAKPATNRSERDLLENEVRKDIDWRQKQVKEIRDTGTGTLADDEHPMRSFGAGVLVRLSGETLNLPSDGKYLVFNIRGSNRGNVWSLNAEMKTDMLCWKEFAGVTSSASELLDPRPTAIKELYEEIAFLSDDDVLLPDNLGAYPDSKELLEVGIARANQHYRFNLATKTGSYTGVDLGSLKGDSNTTVQINDQTPFKAIVNYDIRANALEISFLVDLDIKGPLTGIMSLAGKEDTTSLAFPPYMEDVVVAEQGKLVKAKSGIPLEVRHLLSVHGPTNLKTPPRDLVYTPAATLIPLVWHLSNDYSFRKVLEKQGP